MKYLKSYTKQFSIIVERTTNTMLGKTFDQNLKYHDVYI